MKQRGHTIDEALCFILVRLCYNRLRKSWYPGGYPPKNSTTKVRRPAFPWRPCFFAALSMMLGFTIQLSLYLVRKPSFFLSIINAVKHVSCCVR